MLPAISSEGDLPVEGVGQADDQQVDEGGLPAKGVDAQFAGSANDEPEAIL